MRKSTSSTNGIEGPPFMFFGFKRGSKASIKALPALLSVAKYHILVHRVYVGAIKIEKKKKKCIRRGNTGYS